VKKLAIAILIPAVLSWTLPFIPGVVPWLRFHAPALYAFFALAMLTSPAALGLAGLAYFSEQLWSFDTPTYFCPACGREINNGCEGINDPKHIRERFIAERAAEAVAGRKQ